MEFSNDWDERMEKLKTKVIPRNPDEETAKKLEQYQTSVFKLIIIGDSGVGKSCLLH